MDVRKRLGFAALLVAVLFGARASALAPQQVVYTGALSYSGGDYVFDRRTDAFFFSNGLRLDVGRFAAGATLPVVVQNGGIVTRVAGVAVPTGGEDHEAVERSGDRDRIHTHRGPGGGGGGGAGTATTVGFREGFATDLGDPHMDVSFELVSTPVRTLRSVRLNGTAKAPLNDLGSGAGSGGWDFALGASAIGAAGRVLLLADAAYWWIGDLPGLELRDGMSYAAGASVPVFSGEGSVMLLLSGMTIVIAEMDPPLSAQLSLGRSVGGRGFVSAGLGAGLTETAPDLFALLNWSVRVRD